MKTVFITRDLSPSNYFKVNVEKTGHQVIGRYLIAFNPIPFHTLPSSDWIFFYSKNAIRFFQTLGGFNQLSHQKIAVIGQPSAVYLTQITHRKADFIGDGVPQQTAQQFLKISRHQTVLFPRAKHSRQSIQQLLNGAITPLDLIIYDNQIKTDIIIPTTDIVVFTSPLSVTAYLKYQTITPQTKVIAIGKTTEQQLIRANIQNIIVANTPSEKGLAEAIFKITSNSFI